MEIEETMKKLAYGIIILLLVFIGYMVINFPVNSQKVSATNEQESVKKEKDKQELPQQYDVYRYDRKDSTYKDYEDAVAYASTLNRSYITEANSEKWLWDNFDNFIVYSDEVYLQDFKDIQTAFDYAIKFEKSYIYYLTRDQLVWRNNSPIKGNARIDGLNHIMQYPELPRGCEVTSLAMLLNYKGVDVNKMALAALVIKEPGVYMQEGHRYYGDPNKGFVGDMYTLSNFGFGVFHEPMATLANTYTENRVLDLTERDFDVLYPFLDNNMPVWVVINTHYKELEEVYFMEWPLSSGDTVKVTNKQHAVVITGYDETYIYIKDPLGRRDKLPKLDFIKAWEQMGKQAITIVG